MALKQISKRYGVHSQENRVLHAIDLQLDSGERLAIMGPSGSGKSTLLHIMGLLTAPTHGEIWLQGQEVGHLSARELAALRNRWIGFVFQHYGLLPDLTVFENVELPLLYRGVRGGRRRLVDEALAAVGLLPYARRWPTELSGGQQQRVSIARALVTNAPLILADEPTGALDSKSGAEVLDQLCALTAEGRTLVIVTHDSRIAARCDRTIHLCDGCIVGKAVSS